MVDVKGWEGLYAITSCGKVWSYRTKKFLKSRIAKNGYEHVCFKKNQKPYDYLVHRLVAQAYIPNPNNYDTVDHIDFNKTNNNVNNLRWLPNEINCRRKLNRKTTLDS